MHQPPKPETYWQVDDIKLGMKGHGLTVMQGAKIEEFKAEVLGVLAGHSPGRDLVLCRLSGLDLERTGVIAGMSGSPIYIQNKLLGAVAYAWPFGKDPIAGVTPFAQMHGYVESFERKDLADARAAQVRLPKPIQIAGRAYGQVSVAQGFDSTPPSEADHLLLVPLRTPLSLTGFSASGASYMQHALRGSGLVPIQGGAASTKLAEEHKRVKIEPGSALAVALVRGDFDVSGIGTTTHVEGDRVYGWGHPFISMGSCDLPLMTGLVHTVFPRQSLSFKMGSPLQTVGVVNADVSTCIAGWLGKEPDMLPVHISVLRERDLAPKVFNIEVVRQRSLLTSLLFSSLVNSIDMEGDLPDDMTAHLRIKIDIEGRDPLVIDDVFSGASFSGGRAPTSLFSVVANAFQLLNQNAFSTLRIKKIECQTRVLSGRQTADVEAIEVENETYLPGETVKAVVHVRPYRGSTQRLPVTLKLPIDLPEGSYTATVCDDLTHARMELRDQPHLNNPQTVEQLLASLKVQTATKRTNLVVRLPMPNAGVAVGNKSLPNLPPSMVQILSNTRKPGTQVLGASLAEKKATSWVFSGVDTFKFTVVKHKKSAGLE